MKQIIKIDIEKCQGCTICIKVCPVNQANITYADEDKLKVRINTNKCIACGACLKACPHDARFYNDDTERFFDDLINGEPIALIVAPAFKKNFENWRSILTWLKTQGVSAIVDVSLGIDICTWAHMRYIERCCPKALITQPCPPIIGYIEKHCPELLNKLSPVYSPILCTSIYLKKNLKLPEKIAALTPCPAKANEFEEANVVAYNVTFRKLAEFLTAHDISIPQANFDFDNISVAPGRACAVLSSLTESVRRIIGCISFIGSKIKVDTIRSRSNVYRYLELISREEPKNFPVLIDALNCLGGCSFGAGCNAEKSYTRTTNKWCEEARETYNADDAEKVYLFSVLDNKLELSDFVKVYCREKYVDQA